MEFTESAIAEEFERLSQPHRSSGHALTHRRLRVDDALILSKALRRNAEHLSGYVGWAQWSNQWNMKKVREFVIQWVNDCAPREHFLFFLGGEFVGMGSLAPGLSMEHLNRYSDSQLEFFKKGMAACSPKSGHFEAAHTARSTPHSGLMAGSKWL